MLYCNDFVPDDDDDDDCVCAFSQKKDESADDALLRAAHIVLKYADDRSDVEAKSKAANAAFAFNKASLKDYYLSGEKMLILAANIVDVARILTTGRYKNQILAENQRDFAWASFYRARDDFRQLSPVAP